MNTKETQQQVNDIFIDFDKEEFIYKFLRAYGVSKTSITRLKKGDFNLSRKEGELLYKKKVFFKSTDSKTLLLDLEKAAKKDRILTHAPRFVILTDFRTLVAKDMKLHRNLDIKFKKLPDHFDFFLPLSGSEVYNATNDNEADRNAAYKMAELYDGLREANPDIYQSDQAVRDLNVFLSRILFCFFAEDTGIFEIPDVFTNTLGQHTADDGSDTHIFLTDLFKRLNKKKSKNFPDYLAKFPYVNGGLFQDDIEVPRFTKKTRSILLELGNLQWQDINPDIFGSMIQAVVIPDQRSDLGMHYTSVPNILKLIKPLFLDELYEELEKRKGKEKKLRKLLKRLSTIKWFDPACGSGNFLIITYKEIRMLEIKIIQEIIDLSENPTIEYSQIQLSQFYGIEIDDFAHEMAILSLWLAEHQMNRIFDEMLGGLGKSKPILPLKEAGQILQGNAARTIWNQVCPISGKDEVYLLGNPPYLGARLQDASQKEDMKIAFDGIKSINNLDYISIWFYKAKKYISGRNATSAFVSTNSICQGDQVALLWPHLITDGIEIGFAYRSFKWTNNAKGNAGVTVIILSLRNISNALKNIYDDNYLVNAKNINPYLLNYKNTIVSSKTTVLSNLPNIAFGSMANDGGSLFLSPKEKESLILSFPNASIYIKKIVGALEFIRGVEKYCLWIDDDNANEALQIPEIAKRVEATKVKRLGSKRKATQLLASYSYRFAEIRFKPTDSIIIPSVSSESRTYIPIGFLGKDEVIVAPNFAIYNATPWLFGILTSRMHMVWVRTVGGKLKTDYRYSAKLCYNTFPFPSITDKQKETLSLYVFAILDERAKHSEKTMAQLYNPDTMPAGLLKAHQELDVAIEQCYRLQPFESDTERLEYLFRLYEKMIAKEQANK